MNTTSTTPNPSLGSRLAISVFFLIFASVGTLIMSFLVREVLHNWEVSSWTETHCTIESNEVRDEDDGKHSFHARFRYEANGEIFFSETYELNPQSSSDYSSIQRLQTTLAPQSSTVCYFNPSNPREAIIKRPSAWFTLLLLFPLPFMAVGFGGLYFTWKSKKEDSPLSPSVNTRFGPAPQTSVVPNSAESTGVSKSALLPVLFCSIFVLVGVLLGWFLFLQPYLELQDSAHWTEQTCVVESSEVRSHSDSDGTTYSIDILYRYEHNGRTFRSNRYDFFSQGSSSGYQSKKDIVERFPVGSSVPCFVNPQDPVSAVLTRDPWSTSSVLFGLIPLLFIIAGIFGMASALRSRSNRSATPDYLGAVDLSAKSSPVGRLFGMLFVCVFWNGIVSIFLWQVYESWRSGSPEYLLSIFLLPFVLIGIVLLIALPGAFLAIFNPTIKLRTSSRTLHAEDHINLWWNIQGRASKIQKIDISLKGSQLVTTGSGKHRHTSSTPLQEIAIFSTTIAAAIPRGQTTFQVPSGLLASDTDGATQVIWKIRVSGEIPNWPDVEEEFEVIVE